MNICKSKDSDPLYYGFVHYNDIAQAERVVKELHGKKFLGRRLQLRCSDLLDGGRSGVQRGSRRPRTSDDFPSGNTSPTSPSDSATEKEHGIQVLFSFMCTQPSSLLLTEEVFDAIFQSCGAVEDCVVKSHVSDMRSAGDGAPQGSADYLRQGGYGFVTFSNWADAQRAVTDMEVAIIDVLNFNETSMGNNSTSKPIRFLRRSAPEAQALMHGSQSGSGVDVCTVDLDCKFSRSAAAIAETLRVHTVSPASDVNVDKELGPPANDATTTVACHSEVPVVSLPSSRIHAAPEHPVPTGLNGAYSPSRIVPAKMSIEAGPNHAVAASNAPNFAKMAAYYRPFHANGVKSRATKKSPSEGSPTSSATTTSPDAFRDPVLLESTLNCQRMPPQPPMAPCLPPVSQPMAPMMFAHHMQHSPASMPPQQAQTMTFSSPPMVFSTAGIPRPAPLLMAPSPMPMGGPFASSPMYASHGMCFQPMQTSPQYVMVMAPPQMYPAVGHVGGVPSPRGLMHF
eukprot:gene2700-1961_t